MIFDARIKGTRYKAAVPDTLDLADRARLAINGLGGNIDPELMTMYGQIQFGCERPHFSHWASAETLCDPKFGESFPLMRIMSGSEQYLDLESEFKKSMISRIDSGLYWDKCNPKRPWRNSYAPAFYGEGKDEDFATLPGGGRMLRALMVWRDLGCGSECDELLNQLIEGHHRIAVCHDDYCFYPEKGGWGEPCAYPRSGWLNTDESMSDTEGGEGSVICMHGHQMYGAARWYEETGDITALDLAAKLAHYCMLPRFWGGVPDPTKDKSGIPGHISPHQPDPPFTAGKELGHWYSHFHARAIALRGLLEFGRITHDIRIMEFVRRSYEFTLSQGIARIGWINCYPGALNHMESCALGDMVALGTRLSDMGLGDYWDDVDAITRNQLIEQQVVNPDLLKQIAENCAGIKAGDEANPLPGQLCYDNIIERSLGVFWGTCAPDCAPGPWVMHCCTGNATQGLYYAWEGIVREEGDTAQVNLFLNRASALVDVDSYLPYEGKVIIRNKNAARVSVRIPAWVSNSTLQLKMNGKDVSTYKTGNRVIFDSLKPNDVISLDFPVYESSASYTINANTKDELLYKCSFKASTLIDISPRNCPPSGYPFYLRDEMKTMNKTPMKTVDRFVADKIIRKW